MLSGRNCRLVSAQYGSPVHAPEAFCWSGLFDCAIVQVHVKAQQASRQANVIRTRLFFSARGDGWTASRAFHSSGIRAPPLRIAEFIHAINFVGINTAEFNSVDLSCLVALPRQSQGKAQCSLVRIHEEPRMLPIHVLPNAHIV